MTTCKTVPDLGLPEYLLGVGASPLASGVSRQLAIRRFD